MAKKGAKKSPSKAKPKSNKTKAKKGQQSGINIDSKLLKMVCSNINPFCPEARGAKLYDDNSNPSMTFQMRKLWTMTTDANGDCAFYITSNPQYALYTATIVGNAVTAWAANANPFYDTFSAQVARYRVVSWGFRIRTTQAWTTAVGNLIVVQNDSRNMATAVGQDIANINQGLSADFTPVRDASAECVGRPGGMMASSYIELGTEMPAYSTFAIYLNNGATNSQVLSVEHVVNYEWQPLSGTYGQLTSQAAPSVPKVLEIRANAASSRPLMDRFVDTATSDMSWMRTVANNVRNIGYLAGTVASFTPYGRAAKGAFMGASAMQSIMNVD